MEDAILGPLMSPKRLRRMNDALDKATDEKRQQVLYNMQMNGKYLIENYTVSEIFGLNDYAMRQHSAAEQKKRARRAAIRRFNDLLETDCLRGEAQGYRCRKCKGPVHVTTAQTRSSDEGATTFCYCEVCDLRWRLG